MRYGCALVAAGGQDTAVLVNGAATVLKGVHTWGGPLVVNGTYDIQDRIIGCYIDYNTLDIYSPNSVTGDCLPRLFAALLVHRRPAAGLNNVITAAKPRSECCLRKTAAKNGSLRHFLLQRPRGAARPARGRQRRPEGVQRRPVRGEHVRAAGKPPRLSFSTTLAAANSTGLDADGASTRCRTTAASSRSCSPTSCRRSTAAAATAW